METDKDEGWSLLSLRAFFVEKFIDAEKAIRLAREDINSRLKGHDERLDKVVDDTAKALLETRGREAFFHTRIAHDEYVKVVDERFDALRKEIKPQWIVWISAAAVFTTATIAISTGIWTLGVQPIKEDIVRVDRKTDMVAAEHKGANVTDQAFEELKKEVERSNTAILMIQKWMEEHASMKKP